MFKLLSMTVLLSLFSTSVFAVGSFYGDLAVPKEFYAFNVKMQENKHVKKQDKKLENKVKLEESKEMKNQNLSKI